MIDLSLTSRIEDNEIYNHPLELVSEILEKAVLPNYSHEEIIVVLSPLLEKHQPSPQICHFFSKHCRNSPRSQLVIEMFSPVVKRILKHNGDFGRHPHTRHFVKEFLMALVAQHDGFDSVQHFVAIMHSMTSRCPFPRVLPNFVAVCLAAIHECFEQQRNNNNNINNNNNNNMNINTIVSIKSVGSSASTVGVGVGSPAPLRGELNEEQLLCHTRLMLTLSTYEDWRVQLAQLLQSRPLPEQALKNEKFIE